MDTRPDVVSTYRMLRLALAGLAFAILVSAAVQTRVQGCVLTSISAYWYTPGRTVFVSGLVAIGVCLVALRGGTWTENLLLNLAGVFAPVVAVVPTHLVRTEDYSCLGHQTRPASGALIDNGLSVYAILAVLGFAVAVASSQQRVRSTQLTPVQSRVRVGGLVLAGAVIVGLAAWRLGDDDGFVRHAHTVSAVAMFACIGLVVGFRTAPLAALSRRWDVYRDDSVEAALVERSSPVYSRLYAVISVVMLAAGVGAFFVLPSWAYRTIAVEALLLVAFIVFWLLQTWQLRGTVEATPSGARPSDVRPTSPSPP